MTFCTCWNSSIRSVTIPILSPSLNEEELPSLPPQLPSQIDPVQALLSPATSLLPPRSPCLLLLFVVSTFTLSPIGDVSRRDMLLRRRLFPPRTDNAFRWRRRLLPLLLRVFPPCLLFNSASLEQGEGREIRREVVGNVLRNHVGPMNNMQKSTPARLFLGLRCVFSSSQEPTTDKQKKIPVSVRTAKRYFLCLQHDQSLIIYYSYVIDVENYRGCARFRATSLQCIAIL